MKELAARLKELRKGKGLSQEDLSNILGVPRTTISSWESNNRTPELMSAISLADYYSVPLDYLIGRTEYRSLEDTPYNSDEVVETGDDLDLRKFLAKLPLREDLKEISRKLVHLSPESVNKLTKILETLELEKLVK